MAQTAKMRIQGLQNEILEAIAKGMSFQNVAALLCSSAEAMAPSAICSILTVDANGLLHPLAAPGLPKSFSDAIDGLAIGPGVGSCGTAAYTGEAVEVTDIARDPLWAPYAGQAIPLGLKACWSSPIKSRDGRVAATFAFYYRTKRGPSRLERLIVKACVQLCAIAMEQEEVRNGNHRLAYYDHLTGLPNRRCFNEKMDAMLERPEPHFGLLFIDIDHLKSINDTMGHIVGDRVIEEVAARFRAIAGSSEAFRLGGDEFAVLVDDCSRHQALRSTAERILETMGSSFECDGNMIVPQVTIGGAVYGIDGLTAGVLRQNADFALYHAKEGRRGGYCQFVRGLRTSMTDRIQTIREVDQALFDNRILTYYQPIVNLKTAEIIGLEALARMRALDGRIISAGGFEAALSDPKVAYSLTDCMLRQVARDMRRWIDLGIPFQHVGVNFSAADFSRVDVERRLADAFETERVPLRHLILEVTESVHMGGLDNTVAKSIERLRAMGMRVALDDFGTGFASLTHLLSFPVDVIKIDKSFIDRLLTDRPSAIIVGSLIDLAGKLNMKIVAEGIESAAQQQRLVELGCTLGQGFQFARPANADATTLLLQNFAQKSPVMSPPAVGRRLTRTTR